MHFPPQSEANETPIQRLKISQKAIILSCCIFKDFSEKKNFGLYPKQVFQLMKTVAEFQEYKAARHYPWLLILINILS